MKQTKNQIQAKGRKWPPVSYILLSLGAPHKGAEGTSAPSYNIKIFIDGT